MCVCVCESCNELLIISTSAAIHARLPYHLQRTQIWGVFKHCSCVDIIYAAISPDLSRFFLENYSIHLTTVFHS